MDINFSDLGAFLKNLARPYPARDWLIIASVSGLLTLGGMALAAYLFVAVQTGSIAGGAVEAPRAPIPVSRDAISAVLATYQAKANNFANKTFPAVTLTDPKPRAVRR